MELSLLQISQVTETQLHRWQEMLSEERRKAILRLPPRRQKQSLCADGLARQMLSQYLHEKPEQLSLYRSENGKPLCCGAWYSISHSGDWVACAVSHLPIGIDVEQYRSLPKSLLRILSPEEHAYVFAGDPTARFMQIWTLKEARIKCLDGQLGQVRQPALTVEHGAIRYIQPELRLSCPAAPAGYALAICEKEDKL